MPKNDKLELISHALTEQLYGSLKNWIPVEYLEQFNIEVDAAVEKAMKDIKTHL